MSLHRFIRAGWAEVYSHAGSEEAVVEGGAVDADGVAGDAEAQGNADVGGFAEAYCGGQGVVRDIGRVAISRMKRRYRRS